mgnify:CR=1 FL=1
MMNRIYKTNIIKRSLLTVMAAVTMLTVLPSQPVFASTNMVDDLEYDEIKFCGNKMSGRVIKMRRYWRPERDALCEGMDVLKPAEMLFVGFEK